jgi:hypothetical protein
MGTLPRQLALTFRRARGRRRRHARRPLGLGGVEGEPSADAILFVTAPADEPH